MQRIIADPERIQLFDPVVFEVEIKVEVEGTVLTPPDPSAFDGPDHEVRIAPWRSDAYTGDQSSEMLRVKHRMVSFSWELLPIALLRQAVAGFVERKLREVELTESDVSIEVADEGSEYNAPVFRVTLDLDLS